MTKTETILKEINSLTMTELELIYNEIQKRINRLQKAQKALEEFRGTGVGVWPKDVQKWINEGRDDGR